MPNGNLEKIEISKRVLMVFVKHLRKKTAFCFVVSLLIRNFANEKNYEDNNSVKPWAKNRPYCVFAPCKRAGCAVQTIPYSLHLATLHPCIRCMCNDEADQGGNKC